MNIQIQRLQENDIDRVLELEKSHNIHILNSNILNEDLKKDNNYYIIAKNGDMIVGYMGISYVLDTADIISIVVSKNYTNMGIASLLLTNIFNYLIEKNVKKILLEVRKSNIPAQKLYEKHGFKKISIRKKYYDNIEDALIYEKELQK